MSAVRPALLLSTLLLGGCASPAHQQLGAALSGLEGELTRLEEELAAMNGLHYQKAIDAPVALRRYLKAPTPTAEGLVPVQSWLQDGPLLRYDYRLPDVFRQFLGHDAPDHIGKAAGGEGNDHPDRLVRVSVLWSGRRGRRIDAER